MCSRTVEVSVCLDLNCLDLNKLFQIYNEVHINSTSENTARLCVSYTLQFFYSQRKGSSFKKNIFTFSFSQLQFFTPKVTIPTVPLTLTLFLPQV